MAIFHAPIQCFFSQNDHSLYCQQQTAWYCLPALMLVSLESTQGSSSGSFSTRVRAAGTRGVCSDLGRDSNIILYCEPRSYPGKMHSFHSLSLSQPLATQWVVAITRQNQPSRDCIVLIRSVSYPDHNM